MAYTPIDPLGLTPSLAGNSSLYQSLVTNHDEVYQAHEPPIMEPLFVGDSVAAGLTDQLYYVWRVRRNLDKRTVRIRVYASASGGTGTITARFGGVSGTASVTVAAWYTIDLTPVVAGVAQASLSMTTPGGVSMSIYQIQCRTVGAAPAAGLLASGFRRGYSGMYGASEPVASEHVSRLMAGPMYIARDLPACVAMHVSRYSTSGSKSFGFWQGSSSTAWDVVGRSRLPLVDTVPREYVIDAYAVESGSGGKAQITIGTETMTMQNIGTVGGWYQSVMSLGLGPHEIRASTLPGAGNTVRICTMQVWRMPSQ